MGRTRLVVPLLVLGPATMAAQPALEASPIAGDTSRLRPETDGIDFAAAARVRMEYPERRLIEAESPDRVIGLLRVMGSIDAQQGPVAGFLQLSAHRASGDGRTPVENNSADIQQAFADLTIQRDGNDRLARLRVGRAEMAHEFIALRDAPNVRRSWDGARVTIVQPAWTANAFALRSVAPRGDAFDDSSAGGDRLYGFHFQLEPGVNGPFGLTTWLYRARQRDLQLLAQQGPGDTRMAAINLQLATRRLEASFGGGSQWGRSGRLDINAHFLEAELATNLAPLARPARIAIRYSAFSGGDASERTSRTFNPLFPNFAYSTEAALQSPSNLIKAALLAEAAPGAAISLEYRGEALWRYSAADAFYTPVGIAPLAPDGSSDRSLGIQQQIKLTWKASQELTFGSALVHFAPRGFLRRAGMTEGFFGMLQLEAKF